jgi:hypothetical protein
MKAKGLTPNTASALSPAALFKPFASREHAGSLNATMVMDEERLRLGGSRETLNPLANRGSLEGSIRQEPRLLFLREQHLFHIF